jgi:hypothetical protein
LDLPFPSAINSSPKNIPDILDAEEEDAVEGFICDGVDFDIEEYDQIDENVKNDDYGFRLKKIKLLILSRLEVN